MISIFFPGISTIKVSTFDFQGQCHWELRMYRIFDLDTISFRISPKIIQRIKIMCRNFQSKSNYCHFAFIRTIIMTRQWPSCDLMIWQIYALPFCFHISSCGLSASEVVTALRKDILFIDRDRHKSTICIAIFFWYTNKKTWVETFY